MSLSPAPVRITLLAALADVAVVLIFATVGRSSHAETVSLLGILTTAWPFVVGLLAGWLLTRAWRSPVSVVRTGVGVWLATVGGGLLVRLASGEGNALGFVIVTTLVLAVGLLGWRCCVLLVRRRTRMDKGRRGKRQ